MKKNSLPNFYFSAYPLKAIGMPVIETSSPSLRQPKSFGKIFPMVDPYRKGKKASAIDLTRHMDKPDIGWFNHYE